MLHILRLFFLFANKKFGAKVILYFTHQTRTVAKTMRGCRVKVSSAFHFLKVNKIIKTYSSFFFKFIYLFANSRAARKLSHNADNYIWSKVSITKLIYQISISDQLSSGIPRRLSSRLLLSPFSSKIYTKYYFIFRRFSLENSKDWQIGRYRERTRTNCSIEYVFSKAKVLWRKSGQISSKFMIDRLSTRPIERERRV